MKGFTVIIPTMWYFPEYLAKMVDKYASIAVIKEILIINNNNSKKMKFTQQKVRVIGNGENQFVNPSWNLGVKEAKTDKLIIANDDIFIEKVEGLIAFIDHFLKINRVVGMHSSSYKEEIADLSVEPTSTMNYGFGVFMCLYKASYKTIPKEFKVWYGDLIQFMINTPIVVSGWKIITPMQGTSRRLDLRKERKTEKVAFKEYCKNE